MSQASVCAINISLNKGEIKTPLEVGEFIVDHGLKGDAHAGKWHRQVSLLAKESIDEMTAMGVEGLCFGNFAENITTQGIVLGSLPIGSVLKCGNVELEITQIGKECHAGQGCQIMNKVGRCVMPTQGIFARVVKPGFLYPGDTIEVKHV